MASRNETIRETRGKRLNGAFGAMVITAFFLVAVLVLTSCSSTVSRGDSSSAQTGSSQFASAVSDLPSKAAGTTSASTSADSANKNQEISVPQDVYGVAQNAAPFTIQAKSPANLSFSSSDETIAAVSKTGEVTVGDKTGEATITIASEKTADHDAAEKQVVVRVSAYTQPNGTLAHAQSDRDGVPGDSRGNESEIDDFFQMDWGFVIRCTDPYIAECAATAVGYIVNNEHFGYNAHYPESQEDVDGRASVYEAVHEALGDNPPIEDMKKIEQITTYADTSCTPTLLAAYWLYYDLSTQLNLAWKPPYDQEKFLYYCGTANVEYHQLEQAIAQVNNEYTRAGKLAPFQLIYVPQALQPLFFNEANIKTTLKRGDIVCGCPDYRGGGHTAMVM